MSYPAFSIITDAVQARASVETNSGSTNRAREKVVVGGGGQEEEEEGGLAWLPITELPPYRVRFKAAAGIRRIHDDNVRRLFDFLPTKV